VASWRAALSIFSEFLAQPHRRWLVFLTLAHDHPEQICRALCRAPRQIIVAVVGLQSLIQWSAHLNVGLFGLGVCGAARFPSLGSPAPVGCSLRRLEGLYHRRRPLCAVGHLFLLAVCARRLARQGDRRDVAPRAAQTGRGSHRVLGARTGCGQLPLRRRRGVLLRRAAARKLWKPTRLLRFRARRRPPFARLLRP
jgi:hypothetical protein